MDCVNHSGINATAYCQNCGKAQCPGCQRTAAGGQLICEPCWRSWQSYQQPFVPPPARGPNPSTAAALGIIPGVGAMYNGQFVKGMIHVAVFAVLVSFADHYGIFGIFIAAWICYQSFEAYHTARAMRDGQPLPDPLGLNDLANRLNLGVQVRIVGQPGAGQSPVNPGSATPGPTGQATGGYPPPNAGQPQPPYQAPYQQPTYQGPPQAPFTPPPPVCWQHNVPVGAVVLIALGLMFLMGQLDIFHGRFMEFAWPMLLIALGVWLIVRRIEETRGGSK
jgi:hypothetical protein